MRLQRRLTLAVLGLLAPPTAVGGLILLVLHRRGLLESATALLAAALVGLTIAVAYLAFVVHRMGGSLVRTIEALRHGAELMATVNPQHRLRIGTGDELQALADEINRLADHLRSARDAVDEHVGGATRAIQTDQARLAAILDDLPDGLIVADMEGRITLANRAARRMLGDRGALLGHAWFELLDGRVLRPSLERLGSEPDGTERFVIRGARAETLHASLSRLVGAGAGPVVTGFILTLRDPGLGSPTRVEALGSIRALGSGREGLAGIGLHSGATMARPDPVRAELYDFSLFSEMEGHVGPAERGHRLDALTFVVFDTETTGLQPEAGDRVISLAGVRVRGTEVRLHETFDALVHPGRPVPAASTQFHGITDAHLAGAPPVQVVLPAFLEFAGDAVLVGHDVSFDLRFLAPEVRRHALPSLIARPVLDTRLLSRALHGPGEDHSLEAVALRLGVPVVARHSALGDALTTAEIFVRFLRILNKRGVVTLGDALEAVRRARTPII